MKATTRITSASFPKGASKMLPKLRGMFICPEPLKRAGKTLTGEIFAELFIKDDNGQNENRFMQLVQGNDPRAGSREEDIVLYGV
jgi:hypothetical protein